MLDDLHSDRSPNAPKPIPDAKSSLSDREVPLAVPNAVIADGVHAWLDGEATESDARLEDPRQVDFWTRLEDSVRPRRHARVSAGFELRVMAAIRNLDP